MRPGENSDSPEKGGPTDATPLECKGLDHVVLRVRDLGKAISFYEDVLGLCVERRIEELGLVQLRAGSSLLDLVAVDSKLGEAGGDAPALDAPNMDHFALSLTHFDEDAIRKHLANHGVRAGETGTRYGAEGYGPSLYLRDVDGNTVELKGPPE